MVAAQKGRSGLRVQGRAQPGRVSDAAGALERRLGTVTRWLYRDSGLGHLVAIDKLRGPVPEVAGMGFDPG